MPEIKHTEGSFTSAVDGLKIYTQNWMPTGEPKAIFILIHGLGEHSGRYLNPVNYFVPKGFACYALDHRGHGKSEGKRGHINSFGDYRNDVRQFVGLVRKDNKGKKVFVVGHSLGGLISLDYVLHHPEGLSGIMVSGSLLKIKIKVPPLKAAMGKLISNLLPSFSMANEVNADLLSHDPKVGEAYLNDPLVHHRVSARWFTELLKTMDETNSNANTLRIPLLIMHAGDDQLTDPSASKDFFERVSLKDKKLVIYEGFYHELFNEVEKERVFKDMEEWVKGRI